MLFKSYKFWIVIYLKTTYIKKLINKLISEGIDPNHILHLPLRFFSRRELRSAIYYFMSKNIDATDLYMFIDEDLRIPQIKEYIMLTKENLKTEDNLILAPVDLMLSIIEKSNWTL